MAFVPDRAESMAFGLAAAPGIGRVHPIDQAGEEKSVIRGIEPNRRDDGGRAEGSERRDQSGFVAMRIGRLRPRSAGHVDDRQQTFGLHGRPCQHRAAADGYADADDFGGVGVRPLDDDALRRVDLGRRVLERGQKTRP